MTLRSELHASESGQVQGPDWKRRNIAQEHVKELHRRLHRTVGLYFGHHLFLSFCLCFFSLPVSLNSLSANIDTNQLYRRLCQSLRSHLGPGTEEKMRRRAEKLDQQRSRFNEETEVVCSGRFLFLFLEQRSGRVVTGSQRSIQYGIATIAIWNLTRPPSVQIQWA